MSTFEKVRDVIVEKLGVDAAKINEDASFIDDLGQRSGIDRRTHFDRHLKVKYELF